MSEILSKDHIEVWLAAGSDVPMPDIGWGDDFDDVGLSSEDDCGGKVDGSGQNTESVCRAWFKAQQEYRVALKRLFVRQWLIGGNSWMESYAASAYAAISTKYAAHDPEALRPNPPTKAIQFHSVPGPGNVGYRFQIDIPYSAFPPMNSLKIGELRLMVDVFTAAPPGRREGSFSTTAPQRAYGRPETFNVLHMQPTLAFEVTPCHSELEARGEWVWRGMFPVWYFPSEVRGTYPSKEFVLANEVRNDRGGPEDDIVSPAVILTHYFWRGLRPAEFVCGPELTYRNQDIIRDLGINLERYNGDRNVAADGFDARHDSNGMVLIKIGPRVWIPGSNGECGGCPRMELELIQLDRNSKPATLLDIEDRINVGPPDLHSGDITISSDWSRIVEYKQAADENGEPLPWSSTTYCADVSYAECDEKTNVQPPNPPVLRILLQ